MKNIKVYWNFMNCTCSFPLVLCVCAFQTVSFCTLKEALEVEWTSDKAKASLKKTPVDYFLLHGT